MRGFIDGEYQDGEIRGCTFIAGVRGMGKTTEMARLLTECAGGVIFFDALSRHEYALKGFKIFTQPGPLVEYLKLNRNRRYRILYQPRGGSIDAHFRHVCKIVRAFGWMVFGIDEIDMMCGSRWGDSRMPPELNHLVHYGRHERVSMLATARRPMNIARGYTSQCLEMRLFRVTEKADVKYFEEYVGRDTAAKLCTLDKYQYLHWKDSGKVELRGGQR